jgi:hypothetical protein
VKNPESQTMSGYPGGPRGLRAERAERKISVNISFLRIIEGMNPGIGPVTPPSGPGVDPVRTGKLL